MQITFILKLIITANYTHFLLHISGALEMYLFMNAIYMELQEKLPYHWLETRCMWDEWVQFFRLG